MLDSVGTVRAELDEWNRSLVLASVPTLAVPGRSERVRAEGIDLVVLDEAHHGAALSYVRVLERLAPRRMLGLTATADRSDGVSLGDWEIAYAYGISDAIRDEWLIPPYAAVIPIPGLDLRGFSPGQDYDPDELGEALLDARIVEHTVDAMIGEHDATELPERADHRRLTARGRQSLVFTATIKQADQTAAALRSAGVRAQAISGDTPTRERAGLLRAFERGEVDALCNAAVLTEGTDLPSADCVVLARPTRSWSFAVQMIGRGLRPYPGQRECLILDLGGATDLHDLRAAPVLIGGTRCPESPNGLHTFEPDPDDPVKGICVFCHRRIACFAAQGPHVYIRGQCTRCGKVQCADSPDHEHAWSAAKEPGQRVCGYCGATCSDPMVGMIVRDRSETTNAPWVRLHGLEPETYTLDAQPHGTLFVVGERADGGRWLVYWLRPRARKPRLLSERPLTREEVRVWAEGIVRRSVHADPTQASRRAAITKTWQAEALRDARFFGLATFKG